MVKQWWKRSVVYQIYPRSFMDSNGDGVGDLNGVTEKLDYLKELGVDVLWLSPFYKSPNCDNGYDISDYRDINPDFGTMADFDRLLSEAHLRGLKIMVDLVVNHSSDQHPWFREKRDFYIWREGKNGELPNNWKAAFGGPAWEKDPGGETGGYYLHLFAKGQPDLNWENPELRGEIYDMMRWWCDKGIDGFRMDVISMISKDASYADDIEVTNGPRVHEFLREMNREVLSRYDLVTVGETPGANVDNAALYAGETAGELNMIFEFEHVCLDEGEYGKWCGRRTLMPDLRACMGKWQTALEGRAWNSLYFSNHDQPRSVSRFGDDRREYRELSAKLLATCLHMQKGTPYIYQGEELGMTNAPFETLSDYRDIESTGHYKQLTEAGLVPPDDMLGFLRLRSRDNARTPMQWSAEANAGFTAGTPWIMVNPNFSEINASAQTGDPDSVFSYYKKLIKLRRENDIVAFGAYALILPESEEVWAFTRTLGGDRITVLLNFTDKEVDCAVAPAGKTLISNYKNRVQGKLRAYEAVVFEG